MNADVDWVSAATDIATAITGAIALIVGYRSIKISRKAIELSDDALRVQEVHNKLSVRPIPFLHLRTQGQFIQIELVNDGPGLFQIKKYELTGPNLSDHNIGPNLPKPVSSFVDIYTTTGLTGRTIPPLGSLNILKVVARHSNSNAEAYLNDCLTVIEKMKISIEYTDVYESDFDPYVKSLEWFGTQIIRLA